jgi:Rps23 Pro-64 3,4-dihydroxylase Tpa1-like proline 4-hydroxylase
MFHKQTVDNSQDAKSAFITNEEIIREEYIDHSHDDDDDDFDDTLDTEHGVFNDFINQGDDPSTDVLDLIMIEGTPELRAQIRKS